MSVLIKQEICKFIIFRIKTGITDPLTCMAHEVLSNNALEGVADVAARFFNTKGCRVKLGLTIDSAE